ncbi:MAG: single-stranded-DNA-specific exonuclease RecJ [Desulfuromonadaceae bacterium]|nr:single-stranded-DNA-specific exonuclease RecJ [Desulfuromonadaceae bacterium]MDD2854240.1 single-stranded-DNA-specific exonuclease RecJ [Desulfuromonadaceae bacterium]
MLKKWVMKSIDVDKAEVLASSLALSPVMAKILVGRGIDSLESANNFFYPSLSAMLDPFLLKGVKSAVERIITAIKCGESVCIYGDYDVDGITGTALLVSYLRKSGLDCKYFIPNRFNDGYGLNRESLQKIIDSGNTVIISVDCGTTSIQEAEFCKKKGVDLIIVDHHTPGEKLPDAAVVINPLQDGCSYPFKMLAGVGVAFNLLIALRSEMREKGLFKNKSEPDLREYFDLLALGTIADVVPLIGQNRLYVHYGLQKLESNSRHGVAALKKVAGIKGQLSCGQVGFRIAPRLNAAGRMESAVPGVELLLSADVEECSILAGELDSSNAERQATERSILDDAISMVKQSGSYPECRSIVLSSSNWHQGVIGIVASRLVDLYHRPTILIATDEAGNAKGSGRSIPGFHLLDALTGCSHLLERFGGHRYAAGVALKAGNIESFSKTFETVAAGLLGDSELTPTLDVDADISPVEVDIELVNELRRLEPFGSMNPEPTLVMRAVTVLESRKVGEGHLKLRITAGGAVFDAIAFRQADSSTDGLLDIAFFPELNVWNNTVSLQLRVKAIRKAVE